MTHLILLVLSVLMIGCGETVVFEIESRDKEAFEDLVEQLTPHAMVTIASKAEVPQGDHLWKVVTVVKGEEVGRNPVMRMCERNDNSKNILRARTVSRRFSSGGTIYIGKDCLTKSERKQAVMHEIGHALGLNHSKDGGVMSADKVDPTHTFSKGSLAELKTVTPR